MGIRNTLAAGLSGLGTWLGYSAGAETRHAVTRAVTDTQGLLLPHYRTFSGLANAFSRVYSARWDEAIKRFPADAQSMRNDCYLMALFDERTVPLSRWKWQIDDEEDEAGASKKDPKREEVRAGLEAVIRRTWRLHHLREYQREAVWFGRYGSQVARGVELVQGVPRQVITRHLPVHGDKIYTDFDGFDAVAINSAAIGANDFGGEVTYTDRMPVLRLRNPEWRQRFIIQKWRIRDGDYFDPYSAGQVGGIGLRHYVYWAWWLRDEMLSWATDFLEKVGSLGLLIFYYEEGNDDSFKKAKQAAIDANNQNAIAVPLPRGKDPKTAGMDIIPANVTGAQFLKEFIGDYFERHIERMIVGQTLSAGTEGSGLGGTGVARLHMDTKWQLLASDAECFDCGYTEDLVRPTLELNWPGCPYRFRWRHILPDPEAEGKLAAAQTFVSMGGELEEDEVRETTGFREPRPGAKTIGGARLTAMNEDAGGDDPDELERIAGKMEAGEELKPDEEEIIAGYAGRRLVVAYADADGWNEPTEGHKLQWKIGPDGKRQYRQKPKERPGKADGPSPTDRAKGQKRPEADDRQRRVESAKERIRQAKIDRSTADDSTTGDALPVQPAPGADEVDSAAVEAVARWLSGPTQVDDETKAGYAIGLAKALTMLPLAMRGPVATAIGNGKVTLYQTTKQVNAAYTKATGKRARGTLGFVVHKGTAVDLHINGGPDAVGTYLHEFGHAINLEHVHSEKPSWKRAYKRDIINGRHLLSRQALENEGEAFAEMVRAISTKGLEKCRSEFPNCVSFLEKAGLL